ncbi:glycosyltransferase family 2 protein [Spirulina sp. CCNP1310]|uniref:glycosyltransferase family 2 protein n=1 Tax=Spirulina sp. CCNP1310 TaxID=3110249 RepID=UPI002B1F074C|nr:glycosyltransferase family 2 protein [Spirulina sp. CCNP1310]MEA5418161.1 glycosyltransferase family 2 protein [Spirulina sp. CCNP1310]
MFSVYILTYNEAVEIGPCLESILPWCDDVIVVDSFSTDATVAIAQGYNVKVVQHAFASHGQQRTWMLQEVATVYPWVYILEADERMTPELYAECCGAVRQEEYIGYYVAERVLFMNRWIRHCTQYPRYQMRLLRKDRVWFTDYGHTEREVCDGPTGFLQETYPHYTSGKGFSRWFEKHNRYSTDEARETLHQLETGQVHWRDLFLGSSEVVRRRALKDLSLRLPGRPFLRFLYMYFILGGIWDGQAGLTWCILQAFYEYMILLKVWELRQAKQATDSGG